MKKMVATFCAVLTCATGVCMMGSCGDKTAEAEKTVMNVSLNPSVEFVLNGKNKVVSVNALNEEGNLVVSAENFIGKDMDVAVTLFVEVSKETGFLVSGNAQVANNAINVSFSGDAEQATELYNKVSAKVGEYLSKEKITATVQQAAAITEEKVEALETECDTFRCFGRSDGICRTCRSALRIEKRNGGNVFPRAEKRLLRSKGVCNGKSGVGGFEIASNGAFANCVGRFV